MYQLAPDVYLLRGTPDYLVNIYLVGDVLIDAGTRMAERGVLKQLQGKRLSAHVLTHAHPDHQGASKAVCEVHHVPLWCGERDASAMESGNMQGQIPRNAITRVQDVFWTGPGYPVDRGLQEGDEVAGMTVIDVPGHSPGHIAYWRERDRVLILGDVLTNMNLTTLQAGLHTPPLLFTLNPAQNLESARKLAALKPKLVCFGHGKPLYDGEKFRAFVDTLAVLNESFKSLSDLPG
jgi:hydroxyacylglutathione hydrolase